MSKGVKFCVRISPIFSCQITNSSDCGIWDLLLTLKNYSKFAA